MEFFILGRDRAGLGESRRALLPAHWDFMSRYADAMIARGPTMSADGKTVTGSLHIVNLPDARAAHAFAHDDPLAIGGVFETIVVRRFANLAGRTMWQFNGNPRNRRFLFVGEFAAGTATADGSLLDAQRDYLRHADRAGKVILFGALCDAGGAAREGSVMLLEAATVAAAQAIVAGDPAAGLHADAQLLPWRFGGKENLHDLVAPQGTIAS